MQCMPSMIYMSPGAGPVVLILVVIRRVGSAHFSALTCQGRHQVCMLAAGSALLPSLAQARASLLYMPHCLPFLE